jgi:arsenical pump membrane protein
VPLLAVLRRADPLDLIAVALLVAGGAFVATGLLPAAAAGDVLTRILPSLLFLGSVVVLAELTATAEVFDVVAARVARLAGGNYLALFLLCVAVAALTTTALNLDTTAVLLTPVMLALAGRVGIAPVPLAMTTVWLANTASLLLPVSNLTNLLALDRTGLDPISFAGRMWPAQLASVAVTTVCLWVFYWRRSRRGAERYSPPPPHVVPDRVLFRICAVACVAFVVAVLVVDAPLWVGSASAAGVVLVAFAVRQRGALRASLFPWRLLVFVTGLFLVIETIGRHGLDDVMSTLMGSGDDLAAMYRAAITGAGLSNAVNNLPAYVAGESVVAPGNTDQLLALLVGSNIGPVITPWASLATLLWYERCHARGVDVPVLRFALTGTVLAVAGIATTVAVLALGR